MPTMQRRHDACTHRARPLRLRDPDFRLQHVRSRQHRNGCSRSDVIGPRAGWWPARLGHRQRAGKVLERGTRYHFERLSNVDQDIRVATAHVGRIIALPVVDGSAKTTRPAMDRYIHEQNLVHYRKVLSETRDPVKRQTVLRLLAEEQANIQPQIPIETRYPSLKG